MIKVLHVIGGLNRGGAETMLMNIFRNIDKSSYKFYFLVFYSEDEHQDYEEEIIKLGGEILHLSKKSIFLNFLDFCSILKKYKFDIIHAHTLFNSFSYVLAAKIYKIKIRITHSHSTGNMNKNNFVFKLYKFISRFIINFSSNFFVACSPEAGYYLFGEKKFKKKGIVLRNSIDVNLFCPKQIDESYLNVDRNTMIIGCIGSFYHVKNHKFLIELAEYALSNNKLSNFKFVFVGKGYLEDELLQMIKQRNLESYFVFLGTRTDIYNLMNIFDVLVMPSLYEGIPVTLIEAQACGLPCVVSNNISKDVDLNLNLLKFCNINQCYDEWISAINEIRNMHYMVNDSNYIKSVLKKSGYSLEENIKVLLKIYNHFK